MFCPPCQRWRLCVFLVAADVTWRKLQETRSDRSLSGRRPRFIKQNVYLVQRCRSLSTPHHNERRGAARRLFTTSSTTQPRNKRKRETFPADGHHTPDSHRERLIQVPDLHNRFLHPEILLHDPDETLQICRLLQNLHLLHLLLLLHSCGSGSTGR